MSTFPDQIDDDEIIVRALFSPYHIADSGKLKKEAFKPQRGSNKISVMRHSWLGSSGCKKKAKELAKPDKIYKGFAALRAKQITNIKCKVVDARNEYEGHAHIEIPCSRPVRNVKDNTDTNAEALRTINNFAEQLCAASGKPYIDPDPDNDSWTTNEIGTSCP